MVIGWGMSIDQRYVSRVVSVVATAAVVVGMTASAGLAKPKPRVTKPTLTANVAARTNATTATFTFSSPDATKYTCALDGKKAACTSPKTYIGLVEGAHNFNVVGTRTGARASLPAAFAWTVDRTPPPPVTFNGVPPGPVKKALAPAITFTAGEANDTFMCQIDAGTPVTCTAGGSTLTQNATSNGIHTLTVTPTDAAGNVGPAASAGWEIDDVGPVVSISDPPGTNPFNSITVHFAVVGADDPITCALTKDGAAQADPDCSAAGNGANQVVVSTPTDGSYVLTITATDAIGNQGSAQASWTRSGTATAPPVLTGPAAYINDPSAAAAHISWPANGLDTYSCTVDGNATACAAPGFDPAGVAADGAHTVTVVDTTGTPSSP